MHFIILAFFSLVILSCHTHLQNSSQENTNDDWVKQRRGGHIKSASREDQLFKTEMTDLIVEQMEKENRTGIGFFLVDRNHHLLFAKAIGYIEDTEGRRPFSGTELMPVGSTSIWVSTIILLRLVEKGYLKLTSTTSNILKWKGEKGDISLGSLLSMTSGLPGRSPYFECVEQADISIQPCTQAMGRIIDDKNSLLRKEGEMFSYGPVHMHLAVAMAEKATGRTWNEIVKNELVVPLKLDARTLYYSHSVDKKEGNNLSPFDGLVINMRDFIRILKAVVDHEYLSLSMVKMMLADQFKEETEIGTSPMKTLFNKSYHFGLGNWIECEPSVKEGCSNRNIRSAPGAFGWYPFIDLEQGYYGILASLEGHDRLEKSADPALRSRRIFEEIRKYLIDWRM